VPAGFGAPVYKKLDADIAAAMMSINAVKGRGKSAMGSPRRHCGVKITPTACA